MSYNEFLSELNAYSKSRKPAGFRADKLESHEAELSKAVKLMRRTVDARVAAEPAKAPVPAPAETMAKAHELFRAGKLTGEQLRSLEAHRNAIVDGLARQVAL